MLDINFNAQVSSQNSYMASLRWALNLFDRARWKAENEKITAKLLHRPSQLLDLDTISADEVNNCRYGGIRPVSIRRIGGTLGRTGDFDHRFSPLTDRVRERWIKILMARRQGISLPPVELIQVGECYFVKDGHHRISVARALGESAIDAEVTIWD